MTGRMGRGREDGDVGGKADWAMEFCEWRWRGAARRKWSRDDLIL